MRSILNAFGPDAPKPQAAVARGGGVTEAKSLPYSAPKGPMGIGHTGPGLGGANLGNAGSQSNPSLYGDGGAGAPGIVRLGGVNEGKGSQHG